MRPQRTGGPDPAEVSGVARRRLVGLAVLVAVFVGCCALSVAVGARSIPPGAVWAALVHPTGTEDDLVVRSLRVPRTLLGALVGAALGMAGALIQGHTRNPLADPGLLGVNAGAALLVVLGIHVVGVTDPAGYVWLSCAGALLASVAVLALGSVARGGPRPMTLALVGAAVSALLGGLTAAVLFVDVATLDAYRFWAVGSLAGRDAAVVGQVAGFLAVGAVLAMAGAPAVNALSLGDDVARSLGEDAAWFLGRPVLRARLSGVVAITLLAVGATAACGPITFVGLVVPHVVRGVTGPDHRWLLPASALAGAVLLLAADVVGRVVVRPAELAAGIVVALIGGPFLVVLVRAGAGRG